MTKSIKHIRFLYKYLVFIQNSKIKLNVIFLFFLTGISFLCLSQFTHAQYLTIDSSVLNIPEDQFGEIKQYATPKSLVFIPISLPRRDTNITDEDFYKGLFYYQTSRYNYPAISFHYVITEEGTLIKNKFSLPDRKIEVEGGGVESPILVAYLTPRGSIKINPIARGKVQNILLDIVNENRIALDKIFMREADFVQTEERKLKINLKEAFVGWNNDLVKMLEYISPKYKPVEKVVSLQLVALDLPENEFALGSIAEGKVKLKNNSNFYIYGGTDDQLLLSKIGKKEVASQFFINDVWISQTQFPLMGEADIFLPGEEKEFTIRLGAPITFGEIKEQFKITNFLGKELTEQFDLSIKVKKPEGEYVEILTTETGYLNVRSSASISGDEVTRVSPGQKFKVLSKESGWVKIEIDATTQGWVSAKYVKNVL